jgi:hypothetical protein
MCSRAACQTWVAAPGQQTSAKPFPCSRGRSECTVVSAAVAVPQPTAAPGACVFNDRECACSKKAEGGLDSCIKFNGPTATGGQCSMGKCKADRFVWYATGLLRDVSPAGTSGATLCRSGADVMVFLLPPCFSSDCLSGTHTCKRTRCKRWEPVGPTAGTTFACAQADAECVIQA